MTCPSEDALAAEKAEKLLEKESAAEDAAEGERSADDKRQKKNEKKENEDEEQEADEDAEAGGGDDEAAAVDKGEVDGEHVSSARLCAQYRYLPCACTVGSFDFAVEGRNCVIRSECVPR